LDLAEGDDRRRRALAAEQGPQGIGARDAVGIGVGLEQDRDLLALVEQPADLDHAVEVREVIELLVDVVADQGLPAGAPQRVVVGQVFLRERIGEDEDRGLLVDLADLADREPRPGPVVADEGVLLFPRRSELRDRALVEAALQDAESRRTRAALALARDPRQLLRQVGPDAAPEARGLGSIADDDSASHPYPRPAGGRQVTPLGQPPPDSLRSAA